jgi:hypothetical protein
MKYQTGAAFRQALEDRLRSQSIESGMPLVRLRKTVAFERFLARLMSAPSGDWVLKGGLALQWRLGSSTRTTQDIDLLLTRPGQDIHQVLVKAALLDLRDWFRFLVQQPDGGVAPLAGGVRFPVRALLDGRLFESFHVDIAWGDPVVESVDILTAPPLLSFADITPFAILCYPLSQHLAEKVHAYTAPRATGDNSRVKDLIDIWLMARAVSFQGTALRQSLLATFEARGTHALPERLPDPPSAWVASFREMSRGLGIKEQSLVIAMAAIRAFVDPILQGRDSGKWDLVTWKWR